MKENIEVFSSSPVVLLIFTAIGNNSLWEYQLTVSGNFCINTGYLLLLMTKSTTELRLRLARTGPVNTDDILRRFS